LREGFFRIWKINERLFDKWSYITRSESRTSSPVRIPRDSVTYEHLQIKGLYPCGEGAGYAGGIISAIDGEKCAMMIGASLNIK
jgi:uncharacterized FAD-dependent dehydrogenase